MGCSPPSRNWASLEEVARLSVRLVIQATLEAEVAEFLGRERYARGDRERAGYRNGRTELTVKTPLRAVRAWLIPCSVLRRCWRSWSPAPPRQLQMLLDAVAAGQPLHLYVPP